MDWSGVFPYSRQKMEVSLSFMCIMNEKPISAVQSLTRKGNKTKKQRYHLMEGEKKKSK